MARDGTKSGGRVKGTPNKSTQRSRHAIAVFVEENADKLASWLERVAKDDPKGAIECFTKIAEYHLPKLQRSDTNVNMQANLTAIPALDKSEVKMITTSLEDEY